MAFPYGRLIWTYFLFLLTLVLSPTHPPLLAQSVDFPAPQLITDRDGLPQAFVPAIVQDRQGFMWVATRDGLCRYDGHSFKVFQPDPDGQASLSSTGLEKLILDQRGRIWIVSEQGDIDIFDPHTERFINFSHRVTYRRAMGDTKPFGLFVDNQDRAWINYQADGIIRFDLRTNRVQRFRHRPGRPRSLSSDSVTQVAQAANGVIWIATRAGLERFEEKTADFVHYRHQSDQPNSLPDDPLCGLQMRPNGEVLTVSQRYVARLDPRTGRFRSYKLPTYCALWWDVHFTTDREGILYFHQNNTLYRFTDQRGPEVVVQWEQSVQQCASLFIDRSQVLWMGTNGAGIQKYDLRPNAFRAEPYQRNFYLDLLAGLGVSAATLRTTLAGLSSYIFRYTFDQKKNLWFNVGSSDIYRVDLSTKQTDHLPLPVSFFGGDNAIAIPCPLATDPQGRVWAVHDSLVWWYDSPARKWVAFPHNVSPQKTGIVLTFVADERALWLATDHKGLWRLDKATGRLRQYANQPDDPFSLSSNSLFCLNSDPDDPNLLWIGTFGSGLCRFDKRTGRSRRITQRYGLPNNVIYSVIPDQQGSLWMGTNKGICRLNRRTFATKNYTQADGLMADEFNRFHWLCLPDDRNAGTPERRITGSQIIMGGLEGITTFNPTQVDEDAFHPAVELTDLQVNNRPVPLALTDSLPIQAVDQLVLAHDQNFITVEFAALQFNRPGKNRYRYRLAGLENDWKETDRPVVNYTNLSPDDYVLLLNATNTSGQWSPYVRRLAITIRPPLWATWWAYLLYAFTVAGLALSGSQFYLNRLQMRQDLILQKKETDLKQQEAEQLRAIDEMKSNFFANVTHEFRTPLTLILAPTEQLTQKLRDPDDQRHLSVIDHNANQLLGLVNQLLDISKLEAGALPVVEVLGDLEQFVGQTVESFREVGQKRRIELIFKGETSAGMYWFDADKLERILNNLLSNALKFSATGGLVILELATMEKGVEIRVSDTGRGITADQLPHIFDRYYQATDHPVDNGQPEAAQPPEVTTPGTGLGLALVSELVSLQKGRLRVTSEAGRGTVFVVELPYRPFTPLSSEPVPDGSLTYAPELLSPNEQTEDYRPLVLVVEDNDEMARYLIESLPFHYRLLRAKDGQEGLDQAVAELPDLILSDVMMPVMDGYALCQRLKTDLRTNHIPVVLLTAKVSLENRLEGLTLGADDYLAKPFHVIELLLRIRNQFEHKQRLRDKLRADLTQSSYAISDEATPAPIDPFMEQLYNLLDEHLDNSEFVIDDLLKPLGMSRMVLYRKIMALTGMAPAEVVRLYRLKQATGFLGQGLSVAETAYKVGYQTPSHFTKVFREQYRMTPTQFVRQSSTP
ncbi:ATP-binding protein [Persicitalea sp.]|uniref:ATP-binding protein n=1 Tax=Persicitalea sp. TaxID=3100273 RepID=UPI003592EC83